MKMYDIIYPQESLIIEYSKIGTENFGMSKPHSHNSYEIYYLLEGERYYFIHNQTYYIEKGALVLIPPSVIHKTISTGVPQHERLLINIEVEYIQPILDQFGKMDWFEAFDLNEPIIILNIKEKKLLQEKLFNIYNNFIDHSKIKNITIVQLLDILLFLVDLKHKRGEIKNVENHMISDPTNQRIIEVVKYINGHYGEKLTLQSIADIFFFSPYYLSRTFKKITGFGLKDYINQVRILEAEKMLLNTQFSITKISEIVGYESSTHFGRVFKKNRGISANQFRNRT